MNKLWFRRDGWLRWRLGFYAAVGFALITLIPQANFWRVRGHEWHGAFYTYHPDETPYAAYVNSLIHGRPRRNDPYSGRLDGPDVSLPESLLSIQFVPAFSLALPARLLRLSAMTMFIVLTPVVAFASILGIFWLILRITKDPRLAATAAVFVLSMGGLARGQLLVRMLGGAATPYIFLPFLRRYEPAFAFPLFFVFCGLVWVMLRARNRRAVIMATIGAALTFTVLVFSYYFLWTAAVAWVVSLVSVSALIRSETWRQDSVRVAQLTALMALPLVPYLYLLAHRAPSMDAQQALTYTHVPDLLRPPAVLCALLLLTLLLALWRGLIAQRDRSVMFAGAFALAPLLMFNQQVLTGHSLQPIHYEQFIANYVSLLALVLTASILWWARTGGRKIPALILILISVISIARASQEAWLGARSRVNFSTIVDESRPVAVRVAELNRRMSDRGTGSSTVVLVLSPASFVVMDTLCMTTSQPVLWAPHMFSFSGLTPAENKERFYQNLYYSDVDQQTLRSATLEHTYFQLANFGWERVIQGLNANWRPITEAEEQAALTEYEQYVNTFDAKRVSQPQLAYVIAPVKEATDFSRIDRWYERDAGERAGAYVIYRVKLRP